MHTPLRFSIGAENEKYLKEDIQYEKYVMLHHHHASFVSAGAKDFLV
jgi:hypothetical protein